MSDSSIEVGPEEALWGDESLKVERTRVEVSLRLVGGHQVEGHLFLAPAVQTHHGRETLGDLFNSEREYIPLQQEGRFLFVNRRQVVLVRTPDPGEAREDPSITRHRVRLSWRDGSTLEGELPVPLPPERARIADYAESMGRFFLFEDGSGDALYVNGRNLLLVEAL